MNKPRPLSHLNQEDTRAHSFINSAQITTVSFSRLLKFDVKDFFSQHQVRIFKRNTGNISGSFQDESVLTQH